MITVTLCIIGGISALAVMLWAAHKDEQQKRARKQQQADLKLIAVEPVAQSASSACATLTFSGMTPADVQVLSRIIVTSILKAWGWMMLIGIPVGIVIAILMHTA
jgi:hypothetical protein